MTALFTFVPIEPALKIIRDLLEKDVRLQDRTVLPLQHIIDLLGFCLHNTYFSFQNEFYGPVEGVAMGSPVSPIVANTWSILRGKPSSLPVIPPGIGLGLWMIHGSSNKVPINKNFWSISIALMQQSFTVESIQGNGGMPFLDTLVTPQADNFLPLTVYCKPTHTDQYLQSDSHHNLSTKYSVIGTFTHRAKTVCTKPELLQKELAHFQEALVK